MDIADTTQARGVTEVPFPDRDKRATNPGQVNEMRRCLLMLALCSLAVAQTPQTPRQALLEMVKASTPEQMDKHLPEALLKEMAKLPPEARQKQHQPMMLLSMIMAMNPDFLHLYETGPILAVINNPKDGMKIEITVERDDLTGDLDAMEFGFKATKNGKEQDIPIVPRMLVDMKLENGTWRLAKIGGSAAVQLDDPAVAKSIVDAMQEQIKRAMAQQSANLGSSAPRTMNEQNVVTSLRTLNTAEVTYSRTYPQTGYTCQLSDLGGGMSGNAPDEHGAQLINPALQSGVRYGYRISLSACQGSRAYRIVARPTQAGLGHRVYCSDQSAVIKSAEEGQDCFALGKPVN